MWAAVLHGRGVDLLVAATIVLAAAVAFFAPSLVERLLAVVLGIGLLAALTWRPDRTLQALLVIMPFQVVLLAWAYRLGVPRGLVRAAGNWNELALLALLGVAVVHASRHGHRLDGLDRLALAFIALATAYLAVPAVVRPLVGDVLPTAPADTLVLSRAYRANVGFVLLFVAVRHLDLDAAARRRIARAVLVVGVIVGALAVFEYVQNPTWDRFFKENVGVEAYAQDILDTEEGLVGSSRAPSVSGNRVRAGSVLFQAITLGFFLLVPMGLALQRWIRRVGTRPLLVLAVTGAGVILTFTRSAVLGAAVVVLVTVWASRPDRFDRRLRAVLTAIGAGGLGLWMAASTGLVERISRAFSGTDPSTESHIDRSTEGLGLVLKHPLGLGLGTVTGPGSDNTDRILTENAYLQVGVELGLVAMLLFTALVVALVVRAFRRARSADGDGVVAGIAAAGAGLLVGGFFLHVWLDLPTAWTYWGLAGLAIPSPRRRTV